MNDELKTAYLSVCRPAFSGRPLTGRLACRALAAAENVAGQAGAVRAARAVAAATLELLHGANRLGRARDERDHGRVRGVDARRDGKDDRVTLLQLGQRDRRQALEHLLEVVATARAASTLASAFA